MLEWLKPGAVWKLVRVAPGSVRVSVCVTVAGGDSGPTGIEHNVSVAVTKLV
jgi:hypothetical protein